MAKFSIAEIISHLPETSNQSPGHNFPSIVYGDRLSTFLRIRTGRDIPLELTPYSINGNQLKIKGQHQHDNLYQFSATFNGSTNSRTVYNRCCLPLVNDFLNGKDALLFSYGGFMAGQTYTMRGTPNDPGLIPMALDQIFTSRKFHNRPIFGMSNFNQIFELNKRQLNDARKLQKSILATYAATLFPSKVSITKPVEDDYRYICYLSFYEVCNEVIYDLLAPYGRNLKVLFNEDDTRPYYIENSKYVFVTSYEKAMKVYNYGFFNQQRNMQRNGIDSDRIHSFLCITLIKFKQGDNLEECAPQASHLMFGEVMGFEQNKSHFESMWANKRDEPLLALQDYLSQHRLNQRMPINKDSTRYYLTRFFEPYLAGSANVWMILHINPTPNYLGETILNLDFSETSFNSTRQDNRNPLQSHINVLDFRIENLTKTLSEASERMASLFERVSPPKHLTFNPYAHPPTSLLPPPPNHFSPHSMGTYPLPNVTSTTHFEEKVVKKVERFEFTTKGRAVEYKYFIFKRDNHEIMTYNEARNFVLSKVIIKIDENGVEYFECDQRCCTKETPFITGRFASIITHLFPFFFIFPCPICFVVLGTREELGTHLRKHK